MMTPILTPNGTWVQCSNGDVAAIRKEYTADNAGRITDPGKFEGEPIFAPYFWDLALQGFADDDNGQVFKFKFAFGEQDKAILADWPELAKWLGRKRTLHMSEDSQGFVRCF
jgi:hypothetical protein